MKRFALLVVVLLAFAAGVFYWFTAERAARTSRADPVHTVSPETRQISAIVLATGIVRLRVGAQVRVGALLRLQGIVRKLNVSAKPHVEKGDVIAEIDTRQGTLHRPESRTGCRRRSRGKNRATSSEATTCSPQALRFLASNRKTWNRWRMRHAPSWKIPHRPECKPRRSVSRIAR